MKNPAEMTPEEFIAIGRRKSGLADWLRGLPLNVPTAVPVEYLSKVGPGAKPRHTSTVVATAIRAVGLKGVCRTFDTEFWVMVTGKREGAAEVAAQKALAVEVQR